MKFNEFEKFCFYKLRNTEVRGGQNPHQFCNKTILSHVEYRIKGVEAQFEILGIATRDLITHTSLVRGSKSTFVKSSLHWLSSLKGTLR